MPDIDEQSTEKGALMTEPAYTMAGRTKYVIVATAVILAFFAAYGFAVSRNAPVSPEPTGVSVVGADVTGAAGAG